MVERADIPRHLLVLVADLDADSALGHGGQARVPLEHGGDLVPQVHPVEPRLREHRRVDDALLRCVRMQGWAQGCTLGTCGRRRGARGCRPVGKHWVSWRGVWRGEWRLCSGHYALHYALHNALHNALHYTCPYEA